MYKGFKRSSLNFPLIAFENWNFIYKYWFTRNFKGAFWTSLWSPLNTRSVATTLLMEIEYKKYWFTRNFKGDFKTSLWSPFKSLILNQEYISPKISKENKLSKNSRRLFKGKSFRKHLVEKLHKSMLDSYNTLSVATTLLIIFHF